MGARTLHGSQSPHESGGEKHPLALFFAMVFAFSWTLWSPAVVLSRGASDPQTPV